MIIKTNADYVENSVMKFNMNIVVRNKTNKALNYLTQKQACATAATPLNNSISLIVLSVHHAVT